MSNDRPLLYALHLNGETFAVREVDGHEAISTPFQLTLRFALEGGLPAMPEELLGLGAVVRMARDGETTRSITGVVTEISASASIRGVSEIQVVVEPQLALLRERVDYRVFREKSVPEIVEEVLTGVSIRQGSEGASGLALRLSGEYAKRPYCVQYGESDLDFVHRLLEDEGIFYYFLERDGLVLGDNPGAYAPIEGEHVLPFRGGKGLDAQGEAVTAIARRASMSVGKVSLRDINLEHPSLNLDVEAPGPTPGGPELYDYPGEYATPAEGARKARLMAESFACASAGFAGESLSSRLVPGHTVDVEGTPGGVGDGRHTIMRVVHAFRRTERGFSCTFESLDAATTFRPPRLTPAPRLLNPVTGIVTGPPGEDIHTDALGRVKVHFHWDRQQPYDDDCSHWIPVLQDNTGHSVGIPRVGWEVLVQFLEGDPDRPVVLGRMYNATDSFPVPLPEGKTRSALKSLSSPGRNGTNQIELDDMAGQEKITLLAERDQTIQVANDKAARILRDEQIVVVRDERVEVDHDQRATIDGDFSHTVEGDQARTVAGSRSRSVEGSETSTVVQNRRLTIGGMHQRKVGTDDVVQAKNLIERVGAVNLEAFVKTHTTTSGQAELLTVGGALIEVAKKQKSESVKKLRTETVGGIVYTKAKDKISAKAGKKRTITVGGAMSVTAKGPVVVEGGEKVRMKFATGAVKAEGVLLKVGDSFVMLHDGVVTLRAAKNLAVDVPGINTLGSPGIAIIPGAAVMVKTADSSASADAARASGGGTTGNGSVGVAGGLAAGPGVQGAGPPGAPSPVEALQRAARTGYDFDPRACNFSVQETLRAYAESRGIRQGTDGQAIPLSGQANQMVTTLQQRSSAYGQADGAQAQALREQGMAWEAVTREEATTYANQGDLVVAGLRNPTGSGHVAVVVPGDGRRAGDGETYPFVSGGGSRYGASDGSRTSGEVWNRTDRSNVEYYRFVPPPAPPPPPARGTGAPTI
ncbi:type VI secretion system Vgr family protein [Chondromyces crocatus]|uniref:Uncharacterized protein n=1 Tax=Chondromyces crocatus TaxID=52 RepID=A0A0K1EBA7_CHOCO|nr:type VI secretion system tip protein TssI/VgrG [Chondromyces crocatus]AKT38166.1 uncharacterized protein CMC5_023090 [Chondromyces crocatus]